MSSKSRISDIDSDRAGFFSDSPDKQSLISEKNYSNYNQTEKIKKMVSFDPFSYPAATLDGSWLVTKATKAVCQPWTHGTAFPWTMNF